MIWHKLNDTRLIVWTFNKSKKSGISQSLSLKILKKKHRWWVINPYLTGRSVHFINYRVLWPFWKVCLFVYIDYSLHRYSGVKITVLIMFVLFQLHWLQFVCIDVDGKIAIKNVIWNFVIFLWGRSLIWYFATQFVKKWFVRDETIFILFSS